MTIAFVHDLSGDHTGCLICHPVYSVAVWVAVEDAESSEPREHDPNVESAE